MAIVPSSSINLLSLRSPQIQLSTKSLIQIAPRKSIGVRRVLPIKKVIDDMRPDKLIGNVVHGVGDVVEGIGGAVEGVADGLKPKEVIGEVVGVIKDTTEVASVVTEGAAHVVEGTVEAVAGGAVHVVDDTVEVVGDVVEKVEDIYDENEKLKKQLISLVHGSEDGFGASPQIKGEISTLIQQLESKNPTPVLGDHLSLLDGNWTLVYTTFMPLYPFMGKPKLPLLSSQKITEHIDSKKSLYSQSIEFVGTFMTTSFSTQASFKVPSSKRVELKLEVGIVGTPKINLLAPLENTVLGGNKIDLSPLESITSSLEHVVSPILIPDESLLKIPISVINLETWQIVTYLDKELKICSGDDGSTFVFIKDNSLLSTAARLISDLK